MDAAETGFMASKPMPGHALTLLDVPRVIILAMLGMYLLMTYTSAGPMLLVVAGLVGFFAVLYTAHLVGLPTPLRYVWPPPKNAELPTMS